MNDSRRSFLQSLCAGGLGWAWHERAIASDQPAAKIVPGYTLRFPQDFGAHPASRIEWWYITGSLKVAQSVAVAAAGAPRAFGFQITFFRSRVDAAANSASAFAAKQLIFAHAALTDLQGRQLLHDQRIARAGFGLAGSAEGDTHVTLRDWALQRGGPITQSTYRSQVAARDFAFDLRFTQTQPLLLQGDAGFSRKGPRIEQASYYYSQPQLAAQGSLQFKGQSGGQALPVQGRAWLDHEWSESLLDPDAVGWDWIGMNLQDGGTLTAFRLRRQDGSALWSGGSVRRAGEPSRALKNGEAVFTPGRIWTSPATRARYPVEWQIDTPGARYTVRARLDNQELDSQGSTGNVYWEGLSDLLDAQGRVVGSGYLEMTGYAGAMSL